MKKTSCISGLRLERYRLGEISPGEREFIGDLSGGEYIRNRLERLDESDRELRLRYPLEYFPLLHKAARQGPFPKRFFLRGLCAAALFLGVFFPALYFYRNLAGLHPAAAGTEAGLGQIDRDQSDRVKGSPALLGTELYVYLKQDGTDTPRREQPLEDQAVLRKGNTVQLAYAAPPGTDRYGVIFSIDGRSVVTAHYPYRRGQSSLLVSGRRTFLDEAYTLDDAPDREIFFMVVSDRPLDVDQILGAAEQLARNPGAALAESRRLFKEYEVETITLRKE
jgi:hypothetical protein